MIDALNAGGVFIAGIVSFFSPCILPVIPVFISTLLTSADDKPIMIGKLRLNLKALLRVTMFVLGLSASFVILGFAFGSIGMLISRYQNIILLVSGIIVILFGIYQTGIIKIPFLMKEKKVEAKKHREGILGSFILGFTFSLGWTPCVGPITRSSSCHDCRTGQRGARRSIYGCLFAWAAYTVPCFHDILGSSFEQDPWYIQVYEHYKDSRRADTYCNGRTAYTQQLWYCFALGG